MATTIKLKNSVTTTNAPSSLVQGEVAINITDKKVWVGNAATTPIQLLGDGGSASFTSIAFGAGTVSNPSITFTGDTNTGIYSPAADTIAFTEGGAESMRIDSSGNVAIGRTSSILYKLDVDAGAGSAARLLSNNAQVLIGYNSTSFNYYDADTQIFRNNAGTERMRIDSSGNVGIGTTSPSERLDINNSAGNVSIRFRNSSVSGGYITYITAGDMLFQTASTERMRITSAGDLLLGATSNPNDRKLLVQGGISGTFMAQINNTISSGTPYGLRINYSSLSPNNTDSGFFYCDDSTTLRAEIRSNGGLANYSGNNVNISDEREKTNINLAGSYLDKICAIPVKTFNYIDQNREEDDGLTLGVIAQDVQAVAPELISESNWGTEDKPKMRLSIYQTDLQYALMKCIQEQQAMIEELKQEVALLKSK